MCCLSILELCVCACDVQWSDVCCGDCRHLGSQLSEIESLIGRMMEADLVDYAMLDIRARLERPLNHTPSPDSIPSDSEVKPLVSASAIDTNHVCVHARLCVHVCVLRRG